ncbi:MAG TPA: cysteine synthase B, partial [Nitrospirota bacterium]
AVKVARQMESGTVVTLFPDRGDRYLSTALYKSICGKCNP